MSDISETESTSTRPYFIRAMHEWCCDNGFTPHITVAVDHSVQVPREYVKEGEIVLNVGLTATNGLQLGNDYITFQARFGGVARDIMVPVDQVIAVFARENGQGMAFPRPSRVDFSPAEPTTSLPGKDGSGLVLAVTRGESTSADLESADTAPASPPNKPTGGTKPVLKRVK